MAHNLDNGIMVGEATRDLEYNITDGEPDSETNMPDKEVAEELLRNGQDNDMDEILEEVQGGENDLWTRKTTSIDISEKLEYDDDQGWKAVTDDTDRCITTKYAYPTLKDALTDSSLPLALPESLNENFKIAAEYENNTGAKVNYRLQWDKDAEDSIHFIYSGDNVTDGGNYVTEVCWHN